MHELMNILQGLIIIFSLSLAVVYTAHLLRLPSVVGFLLVGILAGPHVTGLIDSHDQIENMAELGVILLLFTIGLEFSFKDLLQAKKAVLVGGGVQVGLTTIVVMFLALVVERDLNDSIFMGFLATLSSTAVVLKLIQEKGYIDGPYGRSTLAILIFQDLIVVAMMLSLPLLANSGAIKLDNGPLLAAKGALAAVLLFVSIKWIIPQVLNKIAATRSQEMFLIALLLLCLAVAYISASAGMSLALGAFIAGLIISESPFSHQAIGSVLPMRDLFASFFFISIGLLLDINFLIQEPVKTLLAALAVIFIKIMTGTIAGLSLGLPPRVATPIGFSLAQIGEFSFILAGQGRLFHLIGDNDYQIFLAAAVLSIILTPFTMKIGLLLSEKLGRTRGQGLEEAKAGSFSDHVVIIGYGFNGANVARACRTASLPYLIIEMNPDTVRREKADGESIYYGDAANSAVLEHAGIHRARVLVVTIADPVATRRITAEAKSINPKIYLIARTRLIHEITQLKALGADEVIPEEYETGLEIFARVLKRFFVPLDEIQRLAHQIRSDGYEMLRALAPPAPEQCGPVSMLRELDLAAIRVQAGSTVEGRTIGEMALRPNHGVTVLAVQKTNKLNDHPGADTRLNQGDVVVLLGPPPQTAAAAALFHAPKADETPS